jgi:hypothetical protein
MRYKAIVQTSAKDEVSTLEDVYYSFDSVRDDFEDTREDRDYYYDDLYLEDDDSLVNCFTKTSTLTRNTLSIIFIVRDDHPLFNLGLIQDEIYGYGINMPSLNYNFEPIALARLKKESGVEHIKLN